MPIFEDEVSEDEECTCEDCVRAREELFSPLQYYIENPIFQPTYGRAGFAFPYGDYGRCERCGLGSMTDQHAAVAIYTNSYATGYVCFNCETELDAVEEDEEPDFVDESEEQENYSFETDYESQTPKLMLPVLSDRGARLISIEQEVGSGSSMLAREFYRKGLSTTDYVVGYHSGEASDGFCKVEEDGSVNGEIIYGRLRLENPEVAAKLEKSLDIVRDAIKAEPQRASLDMRCGFHVHVGIGSLYEAGELVHPAYSPQDCESLYHLWNHLEDTLYRLAASHWPVHRSIKNGYPASDSYAPPTRKGLNGLREIGNDMEEFRGGLNFSNYFQARAFCHCGAFIFAEWQKCSCDLKKATVEFRVFNATANMRKVHAYTALSLAMVESATRVRYDSDTFEVFPFAETAEITDGVKTKQALSLIFEQLPLTESEKEALAYCARNSSVREVFETL